MWFCNFTNYSIKKQSVFQVLKVSIPIFETETFRYVGIVTSNS